MNKARMYALTTMGLIVLASLGLWSCAVLYKTSATKSNLPRGMMQKEATAQVEAALNAYGQGIKEGDVELALANFDTSDAAWLSEQRRTVRQVHEQLAGHPALMHRTLGYWIHHVGRADSVSSSTYGGALVVQDSLTGEILHETPYYAYAQADRFRLHRPPEDVQTRMYYRMNLGGLYQKIGLEEQALERWRQTLLDFPTGPASVRERLYVEIGDVYKERKEHSRAYDAYEKALAILVESQNTSKGIGFGGMEIGGKYFTWRTDEKLKYILAECALEMGDREKGRELCRELVVSKKEEMAEAARRLLEDM